MLTHAIFATPSVFLLPIHLFKQNLKPIFQLSCSSHCLKSLQKDPVASAIQGLSQDGGLKSNSYIYLPWRPAVAVVIHVSETTPGWCSDELTADFRRISSFSRTCFSSKRLHRECGEKVWKNITKLIWLFHSVSLPVSKERGTEREKQTHKCVFLIQRKIHWCAGSSKPNPEHMTKKFTWGRAHHSITLKALHTSLTHMWNTLNQK